jgi:hypothetical protein
VLLSTVQQMLAGKPPWVFGSVRGSRRFPQSHFADSFAESLNPIITDLDFHCFTWHSDGWQQRHTLAAYQPHLGHCIVVRHNCSFEIEN